MFKRARYTCLDLHPKRFGPGSADCAHTRSSGIGFHGGFITCGGWLMGVNIGPGVESSRSLPRRGPRAGVAARCPVQRVLRGGACVPAWTEPVLRSAATSRQHGRDVAAERAYHAQRWGRWPGGVVMQMVRCGCGTPTVYPAPQLQLDGGRDRCCWSCGAGGRCVVGVSGGAFGEAGSVEGGQIGWAASLARLDTMR